MSFKMTSEKHGTVSVSRSPKHDDLILVFGELIRDGRLVLHRHALTEHEGYTEASVPYLNDLRGSIDDEHVDRARAMRDRLDKDTAYMQELDAIAAE